MSLEGKPAEPLSVRDLFGCFGSQVLPEILRWAPATLFRRMLFYCFVLSWRQCLLLFSGDIWRRWEVLVWDDDDCHWINTQHWEQETQWPIHRGFNYV